jgi:cytidylate kinase
VITGPPGAGKSSVIEKLATVLEIEGVEFGALECEQLGWGSPWLAHEHVVRQLREVVDLQRQAGRTVFLLVATTETSEELAAVIDAVGADRVVTVLLTASPATVAERIDAREPDTWPGKRGLMTHARELALSMPSLSAIDVVVSTERRNADEVAADVRAALRDLGLLT